MTKNNKLKTGKKLSYIELVLLHMDPDNVGVSARRSIHSEELERLIKRF